LRRLLTSLRRRLLTRRRGLPGRRLSGCRRLTGWWLLPGGWLLTGGRLLSGRWRLAGRRLLCGGRLRALCGRGDSDRCGKENGATGSSHYCPPPTGVTFSRFMFAIAAA